MRFFVGEYPYSLSIISGVQRAYTMEENLDTDAIIDYSGNDAHGTPTGISKVNSKFPNKKAVQFNGDGGKIDFNAVLSLPTSFAIAVWFKRIGNSGGSSGSSLHVLLNNLNGKSEQHLSVDSDGSSARTRITGYASKAIVDASGWNFIVYEWNGTQTRTYVNCVSGTARSEATISADTNNLVIGRLSLNYYYTNGICAGITVYNSLTALQKSQLRSYYGDPTIERGKVHVLSEPSNNLIGRGLIN